MATHSSILAWRIPWTEEPGGLQSVGSHSWIRLSDLAAAAVVICCCCLVAESGSAISSSGDLPDPGIKPGSPAMAGGFLTAEPPEKPNSLDCICPVSGGLH